MPDSRTADNRYTIMYSGFPRPLPGDQRRYEAVTASTCEHVARMLLKVGTTIYQLKLTDAATDHAVAIGRIQKFAPGTDSTGKVDPELVLDDDPIRNMATDSPAVVSLMLETSTSANYGDYLIPSATDAGCCAVLDLTATIAAAVHPVGMYVGENVTTTSATAEILVDLKAKGPWVHPL